MPHDPWTYIRWSRRVIIGLPIVFLAGWAIGSVLFPRVPDELIFERVGISVVLIGWVFVLIPTSCPGCGSCFVLWNLPNWGHWFGIYFKNLFHPINYIIAVVTAPCPHCGLEYFGDPSTIDRQPGA
jgi:hypothetical protein